MATVIKRDLITHISNDTGLTQQQVTDVLQGALDSIAGALANGDEVVIRNFGSFEVRETKARIGRNPRKPKDEVSIPARAVVKFRPGKTLREKVATSLPIIRENRR